MLEAAGHLAGSGGPQESSRRLQDEQRRPQDVDERSTFAKHAGSIGVGCMGTQLPVLAALEWSGLSRDQCHRLLPSVTNREQVIPAGSFTGSRWGRGYATEEAMAALGWAGAHTRIDTIISLIAAPEAGLACQRRATVMLVPLLSPSAS